MLAIFVLPVISAVIVTILGALWYGPIFGKVYMNAMGVAPQTDTPSTKKGMMVNMFLEFLVNFILFFGFLTLMNLAFAGTYSAALIFASLFWFFIIMPQKASHSIWNGKDSRSNWTLFGLSAGYSLLSFIIVAPLFIFLIKFFI